MRKIIMMTKAEAKSINGGLTQTSKMPCKSYSLPTEACQTGFKMAQIPGSVCSKCYAEKGFYSMYAKTIKPAQFARLDSIDSPLWVDSMVSAIGADPFFRWHDSGDIQGLLHLEKIVAVCQATPTTRHWLPTREFGIVRDFIKKHGGLPANLVIRLSAMYPDKPVTIPKALQNVPGITASNVHTAAPIGRECIAPKQNGECRNCRECWGQNVVSYRMH